VELTEQGYLTLKPAVYKQAQESAAHTQASELGYLTIKPLAIQ
jgi:hypothetical protein